MSITFDPTQSCFPGRTGTQHTRGMVPRPGRYVAWLSILGAFAGISLLSLILPDKSAMIVLLGIGLLVAICIIRWPVLGTYLTLCVAILFDQLRSSTVHTFLSDADIFRNIVYLNAPEMLLILALASALVRRFHAHRKANQGPLFWPMLVFGALVVIGEIIGLLGAGDFKTSLWEIRPLLYLVMFYILAVNTVNEPRHLRTLLGLTIFCILLRSIEGIFRYSIMPADVRSTAEVVLEHDDSLFLALDIVLLPLVALWRSWLPKWMFYTLLGTAPLALYVIAINHRRAAYVCILFALVAYLPMIWLSMRSKLQRSRLVYIVVAAVAFGSIYLAVFWNSNGTWGSPAQAVRSVISPSERDYESNLYRDIETENLRFTISTSPLLGIGFGRQFTVIRPLVDLTNTWPLQFYMPHNNMLWVWMRTGIVGFMNFWAIIGLSILLIIASVRLGATRLRVLLATETEDATPGISRQDVAGMRTRKQECAEFLVFVFLTQIVIMSLLALAQLDQGLMSSRLMLYTGLSLGALASAWNMYSARFRLPEGLSLGSLPDQEKSSRTRNHPRVRLLPGAYVVKLDR